LAQEAPAEVEEGPEDVPQSGLDEAADAALPSYEAGEVDEVEAAAEGRPSQGDPDTGAAYEASLAIGMVKAPVPSRFGAKS
jgi:hypothetical protein